MKVTIRARVDGDLKDRFEAIAKSQGKSSSRLLCKLLTDFVTKHEVQEQRRSATLLAIESIESGRYVDGDEVFAWMNSWGTDAEKMMRPLPCDSGPQENCDDA